MAEAIDMQFNWHSNPTHQRVCISWKNNRFEGENPEISTVSTVSTMCFASLASCKPCCTLAFSERQIRKICTGQGCRGWCLFQMSLCFLNELRCLWPQQTDMKRWNVLHTQIQLGMAVSLANVELGDSRSLLRHFWCLAQGNSALPRQPERRHSNTKRSSPKRITGVTAWHFFFWSEKMATQMLLKSRNTSIGAGKWTLQAQPLALQKTWHTALATPHQTTVNNPNTRNHQNLGVLFAKKKHYSTGRDSNWI